MSSQGEQNREAEREDHLLDFIKEQFSQMKRHNNKRKRSRTFNWKGNEIQVDFNESIVEKLLELKDLVQAGSQKRSTKIIDEIIADLDYRNKLCKLADRSPGGWKTVDEYMGDDLASDSADEKKMRKAEDRAMAKKKKSKAENVAEKKVIKPPTAKDVGTPPVSPPDTSGRPRQRQYGTGSTSTRYSSKSHQQCFRCGRYGHYREECYARVNRRENRY